MTLPNLFRTIKVWSAQALAAAVLVLLLPAAAHADGLSATATISSTPNSGGGYHYELVLNNTGSTTIGTFWFAWIPGANYMQATPTNLVAPANWQANPVNSGGSSIQYVANSSLLAAGGTLSGFSFDSPLTPAQMTSTTSSSNGNVVDTSFVYNAAPFSDTGEKIVPSVVTALPASPVVASVLPGGRSVQVGTTATVFATMLNGGSSTVSGCDVALPASAPAGLSIAYQTTDPTTNALTGSPNTPVSIAGNNGFQTFLLSFNSSSAITAPGLAVVFGCSGSMPVTTIAGVNTVDLIFSSTPIPDVIALAAVASGNGVVTIPQSTNGAGAFAVASDNAGAAGSLTVSTDTGSATLPLSINICQTNPSTAASLSPPTPTVAISDGAGATPTFSVFITASAPIALDPANSRIFVRFKDSGGTSHGSTSVAVDTN